MMRRLALVAWLGAGCASPSDGAAIVALKAKQSPLMADLIADLTIEREGVAIFNRQNPMTFDSAEGVLKGEVTFDSVPAGVNLSFAIRSRRVSDNVSLFSAARFTSVTAENNQVVLGRDDITGIDEPGNTAWDSDGDGFSNLHEFLVGTALDDETDSPPGAYCGDSGSCGGGQTCSPVGSCVGPCNANGFLEATEECDGASMRNLTCEALGLDQGAGLRCLSDCTLDLTGCECTCPGPPVGFTCDPLDNCVPRVDWQPLRAIGIDVHGLYAHVRPPPTLRLAVAGAENGRAFVGWRNDLSGTSWSKLASSAAEILAQGVDGDTTNEHVYYVNNNAAVDIEAGATTPFGVPNGPFGGTATALAVEGGIVWVVNGSTNVYRYGGSNWTTLPVPMPVSSVVAAGTDVAWVGGQQIYSTVDGMTFVVESTFNSVNDLAVGQSNQVVAVTGIGRILDCTLGGGSTCTEVNIDGGSNPGSMHGVWAHDTTTWIMANRAGPEIHVHAIDITDGASLYDVAIIPGAANAIDGHVDGFGDGHIFIGGDGGLLWHGVYKDVVP